jgi:hypothetical protein
MPRSCAAARQLPNCWWASMMPNGSLEALTGTTTHNVGRRSRRLAPCGGRRPQFRSGQARVPTSRGHRNPFWAGHGHSHTTARLVEQPGTAGAREVSLDAPNCGPYQGNHAVSGSSWCATRRRGVSEGSRPPAASSVLAKRAAGAITGYAKRCTADRGRGPR